MRKKDKERRAEGYRHPEASALLRPDVGTQALFRKKKKEDGSPSALRPRDVLYHPGGWDDRVRQEFVEIL